MVLVEEVVARRAKVCDFHVDSSEVTFELDRSGKFFSTGFADKGYLLEKYFVLVNTPKIE